MYGGGALLGGGAGLGGAGVGVTLLGAERGAGERYKLAVPRRDAEGLNA